MTSTILKMPKEDEVELVILRTRLGLSLVSQHSHSADKQHVQLHFSAPEFWLLARGKTLRC